MYNLTRKELLNKCKEKHIKNVSNKKKNEIISILKERNITFIKEDNFNRKEIEEKVLDKKDPISLEPFEEWTDEELKDGILINGYYYKRETIKQYIEMNQSDIIHDPINYSLFIPERIINIFRKKKEKILKEKDIQIEYKTCSFYIDYQMFFFTLLYIKVNIPSSYKIETELEYDSRKNRYYLGCIPNNISICSWEEYPFEIKALDTSSTTEVLLIRISELYKKDVFIKIKDNKIYIEKMKYLPYKPISWFSSYQGFFIIDTTPIENRNNLSIYNSLLNELETYE